MNLSQKRERQLQYLIEYGQICTSYYYLADLSKLERTQLIKKSSNEAIAMKKIARSRGLEAFSYSRTNEYDEVSSFVYLMED